MALVIVGLFQVGLFYVQLVLIRESLDDAKLAAEAAKEASDAAKAQAEVAKIQAETARSTLQTMQDTAERQLRGYVFPEEVGLIDGTMLNPPDPAKANQPGVILIFRNSGQTPAYRVISWTQIEVTEPTSEDNLVVPPLQSLFETWIGANGKMPKAIWYNRPLTPAEIADVADARKCIYVYGRIEYTDAFERKRYTNFRLAYAGPFPPPQGVSMNFTQHGNDAN